MKQNRYPILFLTQGVTSRYPPLADPRCHTIENAVHHSSSHGFLVINKFYFFFHHVFILFFQNCNFNV